MADKGFDFFARGFWQAVGGQTDDLQHLSMTGEGSLPSVFQVSDFAAAAVGVAGLAVSGFGAAAHGRWARVEADRRLASFWFGTTLRPQGWSLPPQWDSVAGDYLASDGWIRLHTNAPHHRAAALGVLGCEGEREAVARAVAGWKATDLESAVVDNQGCAAAMRSVEAWREHPQGAMVWSEPLLHREAATGGSKPAWQVPADRPLQGIRVLDLTRILAGPTATRFLAGFGADVLRVDPYGWEEPVAAPEVVLGKRCARLDLKNPADIATFEGLLAQADVMVHGYRPDALARMGLGAERRRQLNPSLVDVCLDAYGWTGPWQGRRGFDSLIQMSTGIADAGMRIGGRDKPTPLPVQAIDHGAGYLLAAAAVRGLTERLTTGQGSRARASLARTARHLVDGSGDAQQGQPPAPEGPGDMGPETEHTSWGPALRTRAPVAVAGVPMHWDHPAGALGSSAPVWMPSAR